MFLFFISWAWRPWAAHVSFFFNAHDFLFFYGLLQFIFYFIFLVPSAHCAVRVPASEDGVENLIVGHLVRLGTSHQTLMGYGSAPTQGRGQTWNSGFYFENNAPIVRPCFLFFYMAHFFQKKNMGGFFSRPFSAHVFFFPPMFRLSLGPSRWTIQPV